MGRLPLRTSRRSLIRMSPDIFALTKRNGDMPMAGVVEDGSGSLYGTASSGGAGGCGIVFRLTPEGSQETVRSSQL